MRRDYYILEGKTLKPVDSSTWAQWFETADRSVKQTRAGEISVSTVFLGLNHQWNENEPPLLFETMIFGGEFDGEMMRYSTYEEAERCRAEIKCRSINQKANVSVKDAGIFGSLNRLARTPIILLSRSLAPSVKAKFGTNHERMPGNMSAEH